MPHPPPSRDEYAESLVPLAMRLVAAVHDEGPAEVLAALTAITALPPPGDGSDPHTALAVVLAAMVSPDGTRETLLGWTRPLGTLAAVPDPEPRCNPLAVEMAVSGVLPAHALADHEAAAAVAVLVDRGLGEAEIAEHLEAERRDVRRWANTARVRRRRGGAAA